MTTVNSGFLDEITTKFEAAALKWEDGIVAAAKILFVMLAAISLVFSFGFMAVEGLELGKIYSTLLRYIIVVGLFWWFLKNAGKISLAIMNTAPALAKAANPSLATSPSQMIDAALYIFNQLTHDSVTFHLATAIAFNLVALGILIIICLIAANVTIEWCATYVLMYVGLFVVGFGAHSFTRDFAIQYYKSLIAQVLKLVTMILISSLAIHFMASYGGKTAKTAEIADAAMVMVLALIILMIMNKVPSMIAGLISGSPQVSTMGIGTALAVASIAAKTASLATGAGAAAAGGAQGAMDKLAQATLGSESSGGGGDGGGSGTGSISGLAGGENTESSTAKSGGMFSSAMGSGNMGASADGADAGGGSAMGAGAGGGSAMGAGRVATVAVGLGAKAGATFFGAGASALSKVSKGANKINGALNVMQKMADRFEK